MYIPGLESFALHQTKSPKPMTYCFPFVRLSAQSTFAKQNLASGADSRPYAQLQRLSRNIFITFYTSTNRILRKLEKAQPLRQSTVKMLRTSKFHFRNPTNKSVLPRFWTRLIVCAANAVLPKLFRILFSNLSFAKFSVTLSAIR